MGEKPREAVFSEDILRRTRSNCSARIHRQRNHVEHISWKSHEGNKVGFHLLSHGPDKGRLAC